MKKLLLLIFALMIGTSSFAGNATSLSAGLNPIASAFTSPKSITNINQNKDINIVYGGEDISAKSQFSKRELA